MVLTGANRERGTYAARAPGMEPIAAPIADSSWITGVLSWSRGSTVLRLTISGRSGAAGSAACRSLSARRSIQMLLVLYQRQRSTSVNEASPSGTCAVSRSTSRPL